MDITIELDDQMSIADAETFEKWLSMAIGVSRFSDSVILTQLNYGCETINEP